MLPFTFSDAISYTFNTTKKHIAFLSCLIFLAMSPKIINCIIDLFINLFPTSFPYHHISIILSGLSLFYYMLLWLGTIPLSLDFYNNQTMKKSASFSWIWLSRKQLLQILIYQFLWITVLIFLTIVYLYPARISLLFLPLLCNAFHISAHIKFTIFFVMFFLYILIFFYLWLRFTMFSFIILRDKEMNFLDILNVFFYNAKIIKGLFFNILSMYTKFYISLLLFLVIPTLFTAIIFSENQFLISIIFAGSMYAYTIISTIFSVYIYKKLDENHLKNQA